MVEKIDKTIKVSVSCHKNLNILRIEEGLKTMGNIIEKLVDFYKDKNSIGQQSQIYSEDHPYYNDRNGRNYRLMRDEFPTIEFVKNYSSLIEIFGESDNTMVLFESTREEYREYMKQSYQTVSELKKDDVKFCVAFKSETTDGILESYNVTLFPTLIFFIKGQEIARYKGIFTSDSLRDIVKMNLKLSKANISMKRKNPKQ